jgi:hypothetical protein
MSMIMEYRCDQCSTDVFFPGTDYCGDPDCGGLMRVVGVRAVGVRTVWRDGERVHDGSYWRDKYGESEVVAEVRTTDGTIERRTSTPTGVTTEVPARRSPHQDVLLALPEGAAERKAIPICTGVLDYFPAALAAVAQLSRKGNDQHNPGEPLHWARGKSFDQPDTIVRHLMQRGTLDTDGVRHSAKVAWRALAMLQEEIEREAGFAPGEGT